MTYNDRKIVGLLLIVSGVLGVLGIIVAEALYTGYSTSENYISDLGVGPSALVFNSSAVSLGVLLICGAYFMRKAIRFKLFSILLAITGVGAIGVGLFTEDAGVIHGAFSLIVFLFAVMTSLMSYKLVKSPLSYVSVILGGISLVALVLFGFGFYLDLGRGGMERLIAYPVLLWAICFGGYMIGDSKDTSAT